MAQYHPFILIKIRSMFNFMLKKDIFALTEELGHTKDSKCLL